MATDVRQASVAAGSSIALPPSFTTTTRPRSRSHPLDGGGERFGGQAGTRPSVEPDNLGNIGKTHAMQLRFAPSTAAELKHHEHFERVIARDEADGYGITHTLGDGPRWAVAHTVAQHGEDSTHAAYRSGLACGRSRHHARRAQHRNAAEDKKDEKKTLEGTLTCTKCALGETKACGHALIVKEGDKKVTYYIVDKGGKEPYHKNCCTADVDAKVTGKVGEKDGKKTHRQTRRSKSRSKRPQPEATRTPPEPGGVRRWLLRRFASLRLARSGLTRRTITA